MKQLKWTSLVIGLCVCMLSATAQQTQTPTYDPIAAMLDSLVSQNCLNRYCFPNTADYKQSDANIPTFGEEVYRSRMAKMNSPIPLTYNQQVRDYIDLYASRKRGLTSRALGLSQLYFPMFEEQLDRHNLPLEFKYLAVVESALNPVAVSHMGATGIWQFMYNTGKMYNLQVTSYIDERRDPYKSTVAACKYFQDMHKIYGDWLLVIAAYNCGPGNVNRAIARAGGSKDFWKISPYLPAETRGYVPAFIAVCYVMNHSKEHNLVAVKPMLTYFEVDTVKVDKAVSFTTIAQHTGISEDLISYLNPVYKKNYIPGGTEKYSIRLPMNKMSSFIAASDKIFAPEAVEETAQLAQADEVILKEIRKIYTVRKGESLSTIAEKNNVSVSEIKKWNKLRSSHIAYGQKLTLYVQVKQAVPLTAARTIPSNAKTEKTDSTQPNETAKANTASAKNTESAVGKYVYYTVQPGDTLWNIAQRYDGVTVDQLKQLNRITNSRDLRPGTRIKVEVNG